LKNTLMSATVVFFAVSIKVRFVGSWLAAQEVRRGRLKMREWKMQYGQKCKGGKCRSRLAVWKAEPRLYTETALSYFLKIVLRLLTE